MSEYCDIKTEFRSAEALRAALAETLAINPLQVEIHAEPQPIKGWYKHQTGHTAHVIARGYRSDGDTRHNPLVADAGFTRNTNGTYTAQLDETDWHADRVKRLRQNYSYHAIRLQQEARGRRVTRTTLPNGLPLVTVEGYR